MIYSNKWRQFGILVIVFVVVLSLLLFFRTTQPLEKTTEIVTLQTDSGAIKAQLNVEKKLFQDKTVELAFDSRSLPIKSIDFFEADDSTVKNIKVARAVDENGFEQVYSIDPTSVDFKSAEVKVIAKGSYLFKCKDWDFGNQECLGTWIKFMKISPGEEYTFTLTPDDPGFGEYGSIFFDDFESGNLNSWSLTSPQGGDSWIVSLEDPYLGSYSAFAKPKETAEPASVMEINVNTSGHGNINFAYYRQLKGLDSADEFKAKWFDGTNWVIVEETGSSRVNDADYVYKNFSLNSSASNNSDFAIKFECTAGAASEICFVDNVDVSGLGIEEEEIILNLTFEDGNHNLINLSLEILDEFNNSVYNETGEIHYDKLKKDKKYKIKINLNNHKLNTLELFDVNLSGNLTKIIDIDYPFYAEGFDSLYALNPSPSLDFSEAIVSVKASSSHLYKCSEWDFFSRTCNGNWSLLRADLIPGEYYTITINRTDPGFGEVNITDAIHLTKNYKFISNIYEQVRSKDDVWSEQIFEDEIVRVIFQENLTNGSVVDIYVRNNQSANTYFEIYPEGQDSPILGSSQVFLPSNESWQYIILENISQSSKVFDIKILNEEGGTKYVEFDFIHDAIRVLTDNTLTANDTSVDEFQLISVTGSYRIGNGGTPNAPWVIVLNDSNHNRLIDSQCSAGETFKVNSINVAGCVNGVCTANANGTVAIAFDYSQNKDFTIIWYLESCTGSQFYSPANLRTVQLSGDGGSLFDATTGAITIGPPTNHPPSFYETANSTSTLLQLHFEGTYNGTEGEQGTSSGTAFAVGKSGLGVNMSAGDTLKYSSTGNFNISQGTVGMWVYPSWDGSDGKHHDFLSIADAANRDRVRLRKTANDYLECGVMGSGGWIIADISIYNVWFAKEWHYISCSWDESTDTVKLYIDGQLASSKTESFDMGTAGSIIHIGSDINDAHSAESIIDELTISGGIVTQFPGPALIYPVDKQVISKNVTFLDWRNATDREDDPITYHLVIDNNADFSSPAVDVSGITISNYNLSIAQSLVDGDYWWKVIPNDGQISGGSTQENWYFSIDAAYPQIVNTTRIPIPAYNDDAITFFAKVLTDQTINMAWYTGTWSGSAVNYTAGILSSGPSYNVTIGKGNFSNQELISFRWYANESDGGFESGELLTFRIQNRQPMKPNASYPAQWQYVSTSSTLLNWTNSSDPDFGNGCEFGGCDLTFYIYGSIDIGNVTAQEDSALIVNGTTSLSFNWTIPGYGIHYWMIVASDGIEINKSDLYVFTTDDVLPVINSYSANPNPLNESENINITVNVTDDIAVSSVWIEMGGINYSMSFVNGDIWKIIYNVSSLSSGMNYYAVYANDSSRNDAVPKIGNFTISSATPVINSINDTPDPVDYSQTINFTVNVTDDNGVDKVLIEINGTIYLMTQQGTSDIYYFDSFDNTPFYAGTYNYIVYANDTSGNNATNLLGNFTINELISIQTIGIPINFSIVNVGDVVNASDNQGWPAYVKNTGNVDINVSIKGFNLTGQNDNRYNIPVSNVNWDTSSSFLNNYTLSESYSMLSANITKVNNQSFYFRLSVPKGIIQQYYQGNISFLATKS